MSMQSNEIRAKFLAFFENKGHAILPSASLIPENDPTVLFTTAGMQPLVPYLLGEPHPMGKRVANAQKVLRTVDIDEVGDNRHLTFFEMLGNWSLGDYFKTDSIKWSFDFLTSEEGLNLDPTRLYVTVFAGDTDAPKDDESIELWKACFAKKGITALVDAPLLEGGRIFTMSKESNWWGPAGQTGPCGPDTEIYFDVNDRRLRLSFDNGMPDFDSGRLLEIWNNVFMEYNKLSDGSFAPLIQKNVDTGMGLERMTMVMQHLSNLFETDLFAPLIKVLQEVNPQAEKTSIFIVADHLRASTFLIMDGVRPSNKDAGYVLRRLIRRAILHLDSNNTDWIEKAFDVMAPIYQYYNMIDKKSEVIFALKEEADKFQKTIEKGKVLIAKMQTLTATDAFNLYQTFGFPLELTKEYAQTKGIVISDEDFEAEFEKHKNLSRTASAGQFASGLADDSESTIKYHTATHLMHQALRQVLGDHVEQRGSNINPERIRFDFSHPEKMTIEQIQEVEKTVNEKITADLLVKVEEMAPDEAHKQGALGFFGHKYGDVVTVYSIGDFSKEICTGPHVKSTKELGVFKIIKEESVSAGVRRIKASLTNN